jgi:hypothetical protein
MTNRSIAAKCATHHRRGFALPAAIMALVVLSALVAGALFVSTEELRAGRTDVAAQRALALAEWALSRAIVDWDPGSNVRMGVGDASDVLTLSDAGGDSVVVTVTRAQARAVWVTARATSAADGRAIPARVTVGASFRLVVPPLAARAALSAGGAVTVDGGVVDGRGATEDVSGGACANVSGDDAGGDVAGVAVPDTTRVCGALCGGVPAGVFGAPPVIGDASLTSADSGAALDPLAALSARPTIALPGGELSTAPVVAADGRCARTAALNWGDPTGGGPCRDHYPVIRVRGDAVLVAGSVGQGVLLVDGSLRVESGAQFAGVVVVANDVVVTGPGAELRGLVVARDVDGADGSRVSDGGAIRFAGCVARRALLGAAVLRRTPVRWWVELR